MTFYVDPANPRLKQNLEALTPTPGYCVVADICDSTRMKQGSFLRWVALFANAFTNVEVFKLLGTRPLKVIGDAKMFFVPRSHLQQSNQSPLQLFGGLASVVDEPDPAFPDMRVAVVSGHACELTFLQGQDDVYGTDIDLTFRLSAKARPREVIMNQQFRDEVVASYRAGAGFDEVQRIRERPNLDLKGIGVITAYVYSGK